MQLAAAANHKGLFTDCDVGGRHRVGDGGKRGGLEGSERGAGRRQGFDLLLALQGEDAGRKRRKPTSGEETVNQSER